MLTARRFLKEHVMNLTRRTAFRSAIWTAE